MLAVALGFVARLARDGQMVRAGAPDDRASRAVADPVEG
jgi:hypothetical protein